MVMPKVTRNPYGRHGGLVSRGRSECYSMTSNNLYNSREGCEIHRENPVCNTLQLFSG
jgi:hypothetical protein